MMTLKPLACALLMTLTTMMAHAEDPARHLDQPGPTPMMGPEEDRDHSRLPADNPLGAPTIPHRITGHQMDRQFNRCLSCHGREAPPQLGARPMPDSHYQDRDGESRHQGAANRLPCTACHVPQMRGSGAPLGHPATGPREP